MGKRPSQVALQSGFKLPFVRAILFRLSYRRFRSHVGLARRVVCCRGDGASRRRSRRTPFVWLGVSFWASSGGIVSYPKSEDFDPGMDGIHQVWRVDPDGVFVSLFVRRADVVFILSLLSRCGVASRDSQLDYERGELERVGQYNALCASRVDHRFRDPIKPFVLQGSVSDRGDSRSA